MYDEEKRTGIKIYTLIFVILLVTFIGFIIFKSMDDSETVNNRTQKRSQIKSNN